MSWQHMEPVCWPQPREARRPSARSAPLPARSALPHAQSTLPHAQSAHSSTPHAPHATNHIVTQTQYLNLLSDTALLKRALARVRVRVRVRERVQQANNRNTCMETVSFFPFPQSSPLWYSASYTYSKYIYYAVILGYKAPPGYSIIILVVSSKRCIYLS